MIKISRTSFGYFSLTPCFSWVLKWSQWIEPLQRFFACVQTAETVFAIHPPQLTQLKQGVNEMDFIE